MSPIARAALLAAALLLGAQSSLHTLAQEPGPGQLHEGETVLVDDGTCPQGQIKQVTAGSNRSLQTGAHQQGGRRHVRCVSR